MLRWCQSSVDLDLTLGPLTLGEKGEKGEKDVGNLPVVGKCWKNHGKTMIKKIQMNQMESYTPISCGDRIDIDSN